MFAWGVHVSAVSEPGSHFLMAVADTIHEIEESALPNRTRSQPDAAVAAQVTDADALMTASLDAVAVTAAEATAETLRVRSAAADALTAEDASAEAL